VGSGKRMTFGTVETLLSDWMGRNAFVAWLEHPRPWEVEHEIIHSVSLPLNLQGNGQHPFASTLVRLREEARAGARALPILA
jgi:hypothetical protein